jgi:hypothetical protein
VNVLRTSLYDFSGSEFEVPMMIVLRQLIGTSNSPHCDLGWSSRVPLEAIRNTEPKCITAGTVGQCPGLDQKRTAAMRKRIGAKIPGVDCERFPTDTLLDGEL